MKYTKQEITDAKNSLLKTLETYPDRKLIILITKVSSSGMTRRMKVYIAGENGGLANLTYYVARACDLSGNGDGVKVSGCGMDMAFWLADHITYCLYGEEKYKMEKEGKFIGNGGSCLDWQAIY